MISQFSDLILNHTYLFYLLKVIGHFTPIIVGGEPYLASLKHRNPVVAPYIAQNLFYLLHG